MVRLSSMPDPQNMLDRPDPLRCGCESAGLLSVDDALAWGLAMLPLPRPAESVPLGQAIGRVLAEPVRSPLPLPPFDNAAMDGYALRRADLSAAGPWRLPLRGRVRAGDAPGVLGPKSVCRILTGAAIPQGADCVIAQEAVTLQGGQVHIAQRPGTGAHIRRTGEDLAVGAPILAAGRLIGAREMAALASVGCAAVAVRPRLRVAILATGSELVEPGEPLGPGQIWNSNRFLLAAAMDAPWIERIDLGALPDDPARLASALREIAGRVDLLVSTGGVSVGDEDHMVPAFEGVGGTLHVMKLAMKPGKPLVLGRLGQAVWVGLPGNPVAAFTAWTVIGAPLAAAMAGRRDPGGRKQVVRLAHALSHRPGRCEYRPARVLGHDGQGALRIACLDAPGSHRVALLAEAEGLVLIPAEVDALPAGALVEYLPF
ncbi:MAG: gephyrin-like molybdotransferase Glp [Pararhodobacter sp.]